MKEYRISVEPEVRISANTCPLTAMGSEAGFSLPSLQLESTWMVYLDRPEVADKPLLAGAVRLSKEGCVREITIKVHENGVLEIQTK